MKCFYKILLLMLIVMISANSQTKYWQQISGPIYGYPSDLAFDSKGNIYVTSAKSYYGSIYRFTNDGGNWERIDTIKYGSSSTYSPGYSSIYIDSLDNIYVTAFTGKTGIYRSSDGGKTWIKIGAGHRALTFNEKGNMFVGVSNAVFRAPHGTIEPTPVLYTNTPVTAISIDQNTQDVWVGCAPHDCIYLSSDNGENWIRMDLSYSDTYISDVTCINSNSKGDVFAGRHWINLYKSSNKGITWQVIRINNEDQVIYSMEIGKYDEIFVGTPFTLYRSRDDGISWEELDDGLYSDRRSVRVLKFDSEGYLYACVTEESQTDSFYLYKTSEIAVSVEEDEYQIPQEFSLKQNYPNPFNPVTTIEYQIARSEFVTLKIYDVLGKEVATLVNEEKPSGRYKVQFSVGSFGNAEGLTSGIYLYKLKAGNFTDTKKLLLLR